MEEAAAAAALLLEVEERHDPLGMTEVRLK